MIKLLGLFKTPETDFNILIHFTFVIDTNVFELPANEYLTRQQYLTYDTFLLRIMWRSITLREEERETGKKKEVGRKRKSNY